MHIQRLAVNRALNMRRRHESTQVGVLDHDLMSQQKPLFRCIADWMQAAQLRKQQLDIIKGIAEGWRF